MSIKELVEFASNKINFLTLDSYIGFCQRFLDFTSSGLQAIIISQNEQNYCFYQYRQDGYFNISRPINSELFYSAENSDVICEQFIEILLNAKDIAETDENNRVVIRNSIYTIQQTIGAALDALPSGQSNIARKINGDLFERLIRLLFSWRRIKSRWFRKNIQQRPN